MTTRPLPRQGQRKTNCTCTCALHTHQSIGTFVGTWPCDDVCTSQCRECDGAAVKDLCRPSPLATSNTADFSSPAWRHHDSHLLLQWHSEWDAGPRADSPVHRPT